MRGRRGVGCRHPQGLTVLTLLRRPGGVKSPPEHSPEEKGSRDPSSTHPKRRVRRPTGVERNMRDLHGGVRGRPRNRRGSDPRGVGVVGGPGSGGRTDEVEERSTDTPGTLGPPRRTETVWGSPTEPGRTGERSPETQASRESPQDRLQDPPSPLGTSTARGSPEKSPEVPTPPRRTEAAQSRRTNRPSYQWTPTPLPHPLRERDPWTDGRDGKNPGVSQFRHRCVVGLSFVRFFMCPRDGVGRPQSRRESGRKESRSFSRRFWTGARTEEWGEFL